MTGDRIDLRSREKLLQQENEELRARLAEAEQALQAIRSGDVDALIIDGPHGEQVFSLTGAESVYRVIVETMNEAALTVSPKGTILFCNRRLADLLTVALHEVVGRSLADFIEPTHRARFLELLVQWQTEPSRCRLLLQSAGKTPVPAQFSGTVLTTESDPCICLVVTDLTQAEAAEDFIRLLENHHKELQANRDKLKESEQRLNFALETSRIGAWDLDLVDHTAFRSAEHDRIFGYPVLLPEWTYEMFLAHVVAEDREAVDMAFRRATATQGKWNFECRIRRVDGETRWIWAAGRHTPDSSGEVLRMAGVVQDITDRKQAELIVKRQAALLAGINRIFKEAISSHLENKLGETCLSVATELTASKIGFIGEIDANGRFYDVTISNPGREACRVNEKERCRRHSEFKIHGIYGRVLQENKSVLTNNPGSEPDRIGLSAGHPPLESFLGVPLQQAGRAVGMVAVGNREGGYGPEELETLEALAPAILEALLRKRAETDLRESEKSLRHAKISLERRVQERTAAIEERTNQLRRLSSQLTMAEQRERKHLAHILHDGLQQHLAAAKLQLGGLAGKHRGDGADPTAQIEQLLGEAIQMSRSLSAELSPPILYGSGLAPALQWLSRRMKEAHGLTVACALLADVDLSEDLNVLLFQSVRELLFNAAKHSGVSAAEVSMQAEGGNLRIIVSDSGRGFDPQSDGRIGRDVGGFGLFSIRERLAFVGGKLEIDSAPGRGCRFTMTVPVPAAAIEKTVAQVLPEKAIRVLLVDDHVLFRDGLARLCKREQDFKVVGNAESGQEAIDLAEQTKPDVILMDINMPGMNGIEATAVIHQRHPDVKIIGLSMYEDEVSVQRMRQAGAVDYFTKSVAAGVLIAAIRACNSARQRANDRPRSGRLGFPP